MARDNIGRTKFYFQEKVKVIDGFYRENEAVVKSVTKSWWSQPIYTVDLSYGGSPTSRATSIEVNVRESDLMTREFNKKLHEILEKDE